MIECKVTGLKELQDELLTLSPKIAGKTLDSSLVMAGKVIVKEARLKLHKAPAPYKLYSNLKTILKARGIGQHEVVEMVSPGWLEKNLVTKKVRQEKYSSQTILTFKNKKQAFFWWFLENGTKKMRAYPFLRASFEQKQNEAVEKFASTLTEKLKKLTNLKVE